MMTDHAWPLAYVLPSSPLVTCQDRFGVLDLDTLDVPFWSVLSALLGPAVTSVQAFIDILESIAIELRGCSLADHHTLRACLVARESEFLAYWPVIARLSLRMPQLFPEHQLPILQEGITWRLDLTREQIGCLLAHQFLATLASPVWQAGFQNFDIWYAGEQPHAKAPEIYITAVLNYFSSIESRLSLPELRDSKVSYELVSHDGHFTEAASSWSDVDLGDVELEPMSPLTSEADYLGTGGNAVIVSANKFIGFGRSATQEEVLVGTSPEACPAVLVTPPLLDGQVLVVRGCEATVKTVGQTRQIALAGRHENPTDGLQQYDPRWHDRTMLFMDALELDSFDERQYPDINGANARREFAKALVAFGSGIYPRIYTSLWGCGSFGGEPGVKMVILWLAASVRAAALTIIYPPEQDDFARKMRELILQSHKRGDKVSDIFESLQEAEDKSLARGGFLDWAAARSLKK